MHIAHGGLMSNHTKHVNLAGALQKLLKWLRVSTQRFRLRQNLEIVKCFLERIGGTKKKDLSRSIPSSLL